MEIIQFSLDGVVSNGRPSIYSWSNPKMLSIEPYICLKVFLINIFSFLNAKKPSSLHSFGVSVAKCP